MSNGITYDPATGRWLMQCGSTAVPIRHLDSQNKPIPAPASGGALSLPKGSRANIQEIDHADLRTP